MGSAILLRFEDVFLKVNLNTRDTLINTAPGGNSMFILSVDMSLSLFAMFSDSKNLLVLHDIFFMVTLQGSLNVILYLGLRFSLDMLILEVKTRGNTSGKSKLERNSVVSRSEYWYSECEAGMMEIYKSLAGLSLLIMPFVITMDSLLK